jgi:hypothetical protein
MLQRLLADDDVEAFIREGNRLNVSDHRRGTEASEASLCVGNCRRGEVCRHEVGPLLGEIPCENASSASDLEYSLPAYVGESGEC